MPRVIRDSDEEVESKSSTRRTRASTAASATDSPARRATRSNKQLVIIESSPESLDDSSTQPRARTTRSRAATLDKSATAGITKNLRSRKNSASSNVSETIDLESDTTHPKRITRKAAAATAAVIGTPTKTSLRSRNLRAGSEAKSTPPATRSTRVTRASSVDPFNTPNETVGTPVKRRTRASIAPIQQTVTEEQEARNKSSESLNNTVLEIDEDSEHESIPTKGKSKNVAKSRKAAGKDTSTEQSNMDTSRTIEGNMTNISCASTHDSTEEPALKPLASLTDTSALDFFASKNKENTENIDSMNASESLVSSKIDVTESNNHINNDSVKGKVDINDDECEHVDVENFTLTDDSIDVVNSPKKVDNRETLALDIKDAYVKLNRTNLVEKIISDKLEEVKNDDKDDFPVKPKDSVNQNNVIMNAKTAIVLVNDFVKSNEYFNSMKDKQIFDSGISLNNREDVNSNTSVHNSDDDQLSIVTIEDNDDVLSLKLSSPNAKETDANKFIIEALPEKNNFNEPVFVEANSDNVPNCSFEKSDICLKENFVLESNIKLEKNVVDEQNSKSVSSDEVHNIVHTEIGDENNLIFDEKTGPIEVINPLTNVNSNSLQKSLCDSVSMDDNDPMASGNEMSIEVDLVALKSKDHTNNEIAVNSEVESVCDSSTKSKVALNDNTVEEKIEFVNVIKSAEIAQMSCVQTENSVENTKEQLEPMSMPESNPNESRNFNSFCVEANSNEIEQKVSLKDKNDLPSAVTDADGENASRPSEEEETHESNKASSKSPEKSKRKSKSQVIDSDLDESAENLFQDIPAEEWSEEHSSESKKITEDDDLRTKSKRNSIDKIKSATDVSSCEPDDSNLSKKLRKSLERKRESGQSSDSGIQDGNNKVVVENDESDNEMNESRNKSRRSLDKSLKVNKSLSDQNQDYNKAEKSLSKSLIDVKSPSKNRKSLNNSIQFNVSVFNSFRKNNDSISEQESVAAFDTSSSASKRLSLSDSRKSIAQENVAENSKAEAMDVDDASDSENEKNKANGSLIKSRKSLNKSQVAAQSLPEENRVAADESPVSLNTSKSSKRLSLDKSLNKLAEQENEEQIVVDEEADTNKSLTKGRNSSLNESKKLEKRLSTKLNESSPKAPAKKRIKQEESESEEMEVDVVSDKSPNKSRKSLNKSSGNRSVDQTEQPIADAEAQVSFKNKDKSPKKTYDRKSSANKSLNVSNVDDDGDESESKVEPREGLEESHNKSIGNESVSAEGSPKKKKGAESVSSALDCSLQNSIERMKYSNPPKHDLSTVVQLNSNSEDDDSSDDQIPNFMFKLSDEEETEESSEEEEKEENELDSDVEREYNLGGKEITKYSDDDVPGDDCRASEEESLDEEDDGADLDDFVVPDEEVDDDDEEEEEGDDNDDDDDEDGDEDDENEDEDEDEDGDKSVEGKSLNTSKLSTSKANASINSLQSTMKNSSKHLQRSSFSESSGSESDDEATEVDNKNSKEPFDSVHDSEKLLNDSKKLKRQSNGQNTSLEKKNKSLNKSSKSVKASATSSDDSGDESQMQIKESSINISAKNKSLNASKSRKDKGSNVSHESCKSGKNKSVLIVENGETEESESEREYEDETSQVNEIASPSDATSESEDGEDYYRIVNGAEATNASLLKPKNKKLIDCSTPKPGAAAKKRDFSKADGLSITASRRKSGSLNDLSDSKTMSSRVSIGEAAASKSMKFGDTSMKLKDDVEIVATPEIVTKTRQAWKLIPLNQTAQPTLEDTPGTKFLKKAKLNDSFPVLESMKSAGDLAPTSGKKAKKLVSPAATAAQPEELPKSDKTKKRKLLDMSNVQSVDDDSILKLSKKSKKRARIDDSTLSAELEQQPEEQVAQNSKKIKKKKKNQVEANDVAEDDVEESTKKKNKNKKSSQAQQEPEVEAAAEKKRKKSKAASLKSENGEPRSKKKTKKLAASAAPQDSGDEEAPESVGFEEARRLALAQQAAEPAKSKKKQQRREQPQQPRQNLKRLPEDILENLTDEPLRRPDKRQKLSRNQERSVIMPSQSMFSPGKSRPDNLRVDDAYIPLSSAGGTTQFAVVNLQKAKKVAKKSAAVLSFRDKMLARNKRMPTSVYLSYLKKQKTKGSS